MHALPGSGYDTLTDDALRLLASLPSNAPAFSRLTTPSLPSDTGDEKGLSDPANYSLNGGASGYTDTLDGRAANRYFYRIAYVDGAQNTGPLSSSTPPVYLPVTALPDAPVLKTAFADQQQAGIVLTWATSRSADVTIYRIYRTADPTRVVDVRLMELVHTVDEVPPASRPATRTWLDTNVTGLVTYGYRIVAVAGVDNRGSAPSAPRSARWVDVAMPVPPVLSAAWTTVNNVTLATLTWTSQDESLVQQRQAGSSLWFNLGDYRPAGSNSVRDPFSDPSVDFEYRLVVRKYTGAITRGQPVPLAHQP